MAPDRPNDPKFSDMLGKIMSEARVDSDLLESFRQVVDVDFHSTRPQDKRMASEITRPELDAKLETIEARMDGRLARIEDRFSSIDRQFVEMRMILAEQRTTAWKAAGAVIGVFVAVFAIYVASFDSGRETAKVAAEAQQHTSAALAEMRQIVESLKSAQK